MHQTRLFSHVRDERKMMTLEECDATVRTVAENNRLYVRWQRVPPVFAAPIISAVAASETLREVVILGAVFEWRDLVALVQALPPSVIRMEFNKMKITDNTVLNIALALQSKTFHSAPSLALKDNCITDAAVGALMRLPLYCIDVENNQLTDACASDLADAMMHSETLVSLGFGGNLLTDASVDHLADAMVRCKTLTWVSFCHNLFSPAGRAQLAKAYLRAPFCLRTIHLDGYYSIYRLKDFFSVTLALAGSGQPRFKTFFARDGDNAAWGRVTRFYLV